MGKMTDISRETIIAMAVRMAQEAADRPFVADNVSADWCPCCGVNLRMFCPLGSIVAKWIGSPENARALARDLLAQADEMERAMPNGPGDGDLYRRLREACVQVATGMAQGAAAKTS
jgi:hypothetical protein